MDVTAEPVSFASPVGAFVRDMRPIVAVRCVRDSSRERAFEQDAEVVGANGRHQAHANEPCRDPCAAPAATRYPGRVRRRSPTPLGTRHHHGSQSHEIVGGRRDGHDLIDERSAPMAQLPQPADRLQPAEDLLDQLPFPLTDVVTGMPGGPGRRWRCSGSPARYAEHLQRPDLVDEARRVVPVPVAAVTQTSATSPCRLSSRTWPRYARVASRPEPLRYSRACGSVVDWCVAASALPMEIDRRIHGIIGRRPLRPVRGRKLFRLAQAFSCVPFTVKRSWDSRPAARACRPIASKKAPATSPASKPFSVLRKR